MNFFEEHFLFLERGPDLVFRLLAFGNIPAAAENQFLAPQNGGTVSSFLTGFSWGVGSFLAPLIGKLADLHGLLVAFQLIALLPLLTATCAFFLPRRVRTG